MHGKPTGQSQASRLFPPASETRHDRALATRTAWWAFASAVLVVTPGIARAATYYVCDEGDACNAGDGTGWSTGDDENTPAQAQSRATPWRSIDHAEENAQPGDTVIVGDGVYGTRSNEWADTVLYINTSGTADNPITYRSENRWGAVIEGNGSMLTGIWFNCRASPPPAYVRVLDFEVRNFGVGVFARDSSGAPYDRRCSGLEVSGLRVHNFEVTGIEMEAVEDSIVEGNVIFDQTAIALPNHNQYHGIYISDNTDNIRITNNVVYDIREGWPIHIYDEHDRGGPATNHVIANNTLINDNPYRSGGIVAFGLGHRIRNNLMFERVPAPGRDSAIAERSADSVMIAENNRTNLGELCANGCPTTSGADNVLGADLSGEFNDEDNDDYSLRAGAMSIDSATSVDAPTRDVVRTARPQGDGFDVGAFEFPVSAPMPDGGPSDAGSSDAGSADAGMGSDAGRADASAMDGALPDGAPMDGGPASDGGCQCTMAAPASEGVPAGTLLVAFVFVLRRLIRRARVRGAGQLAT